MSPVEGLPARCVLDELTSTGVSHVATVPDTNQRTVLDALEGTAVPVIRAATESDVLGICAGLWMSGHRPVAIIQQLGLFASTNALRAFTHDQHVPLAILAGLYGRDLQEEVLSSRRSAVRLCIPLLDGLQLSWQLIEKRSQTSVIASAVTRAFEQRTTEVVLLGAPTE